MQMIKNKQVFRRWVVLFLAMIPFVVDAIALAQSSPAVVQLLTLDGSNGFTIEGIDADDSSGWSVSAAGDVNGDGVGDVIIGARQADPNGNTNAGESYVVFGGSLLTGSATLDLATLDGSNGFTIEGVDADDLSGYSVSAAGDVNGDGAGDVLIGAYEADPNGNNGAGESYVVFGGSFLTGSATLDLATLDGSNGFTIEGVDVDDQSGFSVSAAGDVNGDGAGDVIIGALEADPNGNNGAGESYVVFGGSLLTGLATLDLSTLDGSNGFTIEGANDNDRSGISVSAAGDVNGDGVGDVIIGAMFAGPNGNRNAGEGYVVFGGASLAGLATLDVSTLDGSNGFVIQGVDVNERFGRFVSAAGDINGDGVGDVIVAAGSDAGKSYVVFGGASLTGSATLDLSTIDGSNGFVVEASHVDDYVGQAGQAVSAAGDVNGDGVGDVIIGIWAARSNSDRFIGESYVVFGGPSLAGSATLDLSTLDGSDGFTIEGVDASDNSGWSVGAAGDVNGDGVGDVIIGAIGAEPDGNSDAGESYIVFGTEPLCRDQEATVRIRLGETPTAGNDVILGTVTDDVIESLGGGDIICGLAGDDTINAGTGNNWVDAGSGDDTITSLQGADVILGGEGADSINSGAGDDVVNGGSGDDSINAGDGNDEVFGLAGADIINSGDGDDIVISGAGNDLVFALDGDDVINGGAGDDELHGGDGADDMFGQSGNDVLFGNAGNDFIVGVAGTDEISGGLGDDTLNGGPDNDIVNGDAGNDTVYGLTGDDSVDGGDGNDQVFGQAGVDIVTGGNGDDELFGNEGDDTLTDASGNNILNGGPGNDTITGGSGDDNIFGDGNLEQAGDDVIDGGAGSDLILGLSGADTITADDGVADTVNGGPDVDVCTTDAADTVFKCP